MHVCPPLSCCYCCLNGIWRVTQEDCSPVALDIYSFWCKRQYLPLFTLFRHRVCCLVVPQQIPKMNKISRWFCCWYSVDLPSSCVSGLFCWRVSPSVSAPTGGMAGCSSNVEASNNAIVGLSPESGLTVCECQQKDLEIADQFLQFSTALCHEVLHRPGLKGCSAIMFVISLI